MHPDEQSRGLISSLTPQKLSRFRDLQRRRERAQTLAHDSDYAYYKAKHEMVGAALTAEAAKTELAKVESELEAFMGEEGFSNHTPASAPEQSLAPSAPPRSPGPQR